MKHPSKLHWQVVAQSGHGLGAPTSQPAMVTATWPHPNLRERMSRQSKITIPCHLVLLTPSSGQKPEYPRGWGPAHHRGPDISKGGPLAQLGPHHVLSTPISSPGGQSQEFVFSKVIIPRPAHLLLSPFSNFSSTLGSPRTNWFLSPRPTWGQMGTTELPFFTKLNQP